MTLLESVIHLPARFRRVTESGTYVPQIDGLRFLAIMPVLFWHAAIRASKLHPEIPVREAVAWLPHGHVGVALFFFISGYIIAFPSVAGRPPTMRHFFLRRLFRLEPPYIVAMVAAFLALTVSGYRPPSGEALSFRGDIPLWHSLAASLVYLHWLVYGSPSTLNPPAWSLEVEIQFYLLSPLLLGAYRRLGERRVRMTAITIAALAMLVLSCWLDTLYGRYGLHRWTLVGHAPAFLLGIAACDYALVARPFHAPTKPAFDLALVVGIGVLLFAGLFWIEESGDFALGIARDLARLGGILLIFIGGARGPIGRRFLGAPWIALIGGMCYSIYLTHIMAMQAAYMVLHRILPHGTLAGDIVLWFAILAPLAIVCGFVFYLLVERPCMAPNWPARLIARLRGSAGAPASGRVAG